MAPAAPARRGREDGARARRTPSTRAAVPERMVTAERAGGLGHAGIAEIQRARILAATLDAVTELGAGNASVADIVERSGVSRRTFYDLFTDRGDCFHAAFEQALADARDLVVPAFEQGSCWRERVRAGLIALLCFFDRHPQVGRLLLTESLAGGPRTLARRSEVIAQLTRIVEEGAGERKATSAPSSLTGEGLVGGVVSVIQRRLVEEPHASLVELTNPLMSAIVLPYLGAGAARRELQRPMPVSTPPLPRLAVARNPLKGAGMRLTYRTVRVLMAVDRHPGASNRLIGQTAEIKDQGQISKLLSRLQRAGMVANDGQGANSGAPNEWKLTTAGQQVTDSIRAHTENSSEKERKPA